MSETTLQSEHELARLPIVKTQDVLLARYVGREEATRLGFGAQALTHIATAISEITRNIVQHARASGQIRVFDVLENGRRGLRVAIEDDGCGIADIDRVFTGSSPGAGIPGCRKMMDTFTIRSSQGAGTCVVMTKWLPVSPLGDLRL